MTNNPIKEANIINILGIESLPLQKKQEVVESATKLVETRAMNRVVSQLGQEKAGKLESILAQKDAESVGKFFEENNVDYIAILEEELERVKVEMAQIAE